MYEKGLSWPFRCANLTELTVSLVIFSLLTVFTCGPIVLVLITAKDVAILLVAILLFLVVIADYAVTQVCLIAIAPTISHTVAQRFNPVAYFCVISIQSVLFYAVGLIGAGFIGDPMSRTDWMHACLQCLGLVVISLVLVFPATFPLAGIKVKEGEPAANPFHDDDPEKVFGMRPVNWYDVRASTATANTNRFNSLQVFDISGNLSGNLHALVFFLGYGMEAFSLIYYFSWRDSDELLDTWWQVYILTALIISLICLLAFAICQGLLVFNLYHVSNQIQLALEVYAIFMMIMGVVLLSLSEGSLVRKLKNV